MAKRMEGVALFPVLPAKIALDLAIGKLVALLLDKNYILPAGFANGVLPLNEPHFKRIHG